MDDPDGSRFRQTLDALPWPVFSVDRDLRYVAFNRAHADEMRLLHGGEIEIGGRLTDHSAAGAEGYAVRSALDRALAGETVEVRAGAAGSTGPHSISHIPLREDGDVVGVTVVAAGVTGRSAATELTGTSVLLRSIIDGTSDAVYVKDTEGRYVLANAAVLRAVGKPLDEVLGSDDAALFPPEEAAAIMRHDRSAMESTCAVTYEEVLTTAGGEEHCFLSTKGPIRGSGGDVVGVFGIARNITGRRHAEEALRAAIEELRVSNEDLEQFAYAASHDLREPLRMVSSYTELLRKRYAGRLDADADDFIGFAVDGAHRMQCLIDDLLEYSRVGTRGRPMAPVPARPAVDLALGALAAAIDETGAVIRVDELPVVPADEEQLARIFQNLIGNAIKFRRAGTVPHVSVSALRDGDDWRFLVRDDGIGIDPQDSERVFAVFQRLHARDAYPGTGIGLAICRRAIERHGGRIWVESEIGQGTTFLFTLPATPAGDARAAAGRSNPGLDRRPRSEDMR